MKDLSLSDMRALFAALEILNSDFSAETLEARTLAAVGAAISADIIGFAGFDDCGAPTADNWSNQPLSSAELEAFAANAAEHPNFGAVVFSKRVEALKLTDFTTLEKFRRTNLYNEFYRRIGIEQQMTIRLPESDERFFSCALNRQRRDFSERERQLLNLLAPHLTHAFHVAAAVAKIARERATLMTAFEKVAQGVIVTGEAGAVRFISAAAEDLLAKYFTADLRRGGTLPDELALPASHYANLHESSANVLEPLAPLTFRSLAGELKASFSYNTNTRETVIVLEEKELVSPAAFERVGLTKREAEVLYWIAQGKTNIEIGMLCGISWRTVQKHLEHIFDKFGVETRTAALLYALEQINKTPE